MTPVVRWLRVATLAGIFALAFAGAWNHDLWAYDEPREVELARALWRSHEGAFLQLGGRPFLDKPPLFHASVAGAFALVGQPSVLAARTVAALWGLAAVALTAWLAKRRFGPGAGVLAAVVLATTQRFVVTSHEVVLDIGLLAFTTAAIAFGLEASRERKRGLAVLAGLALAGAFLTKGIVGVGLAGLVLALDLALRRDLRGARTLFHPFAVLAFFVPVLAYAAALWHDAGERAPEFVYELFWSNQFGRFLGDHVQKSSKWTLYLATWPEMLGVWALPSVLAFVAAARALRRSDQDAGERDTLRLVLAWAIVPLVFLSFSKGRARSYALPIVPAYALLVVWWWRDVVASGSVPRLGRALLSVATIGGALAVAGSVVAIAVHEPGSLDALEVTGAVVALAAAVGLVLGARKDAAFSSSEAAALLAGLIIIGAGLVSWGTFMVRRGDASRSYRPLAEEVFRVAGERRICLYHVSNSYSGTFGFYRDRSALEFDEAQDPDGRLLARELGPASHDVVLGPTGAFELMLPAVRADLAVVWSGLRDDDRDSPRKAWSLCVRRSDVVAQHP